MAPALSPTNQQRAAAPRRATPSNLGFLLAKASQRWNELLYERFVERGWAEVRPAYGSILLPLFEEDALRMGELASRAGLAKQTMTTMVRLLERDGLVSREPDPGDGRAMRIRLTPKAQRFRPVAEEVLSELDDLVTLSLGDRRSKQLATDLEEVIAL
jgi:MarR family transcriptional regulator, transcriptional regulator for hemolysin